MLAFSLLKTKRQIRVSEMQTKYNTVRPVQVTPGPFQAHKLHCRVEQLRSIQQLLKEVQRFSSLYWLKEKIVKLVV
jgi:hypothetical protein